MYTRLWYNYLTMKNYLKLLGVLFIFSSLIPAVAKAAMPEVKINDHGFAAKFVSQSLPDPITIEAGKTQTITFKFKNIGTAVWPASGKKFISAYTMEPRERLSVFKGTNWKNGGQTNAISAITKPGATAELTVEFKASLKIGVYVEKFYLASENNSWVKGGYFFVKINVVSAKTKPTAVVPTTTPSIFISSSTAESVVYKVNRLLFNFLNKKAAYSCIFVVGSLLTKVYGFNDIDLVILDKEHDRLVILDIKTCSKFFSSLA